MPPKHSLFTHCKDGPERGCPQRPEDKANSVRSVLLSILPVVRMCFFAF